MGGRGRCVFREQIKRVCQQGVSRVGEKMCSLRNRGLQNSIERTSRFLGSSERSGSGPFARRSLSTLHGPPDVFISRVLVLVLVRDGVGEKMWSLRSKGLQKLDREVARVPRKFRTQWFRPCHASNLPIIKGPPDDFISRVLGVVTDGG